MMKEFRLMASFSGNSHVMHIIKSLFISATASLFFCFSIHASERPNIVYILCDDLGYGDVKCLNAQGKISTPHMDRIATEGMIFTDAHGSSAVCTPTRYGIMTGRYNWRTRLQSGVLGGLSPRLIEEGRLTVAAMLKAQGYHTSCVGKWHLGMNWVKLPGKEVTELNIEKPDQNRNVDYAQPVTNGPNSVGFDYYFGISGSLDMVPYTFIENDRVTVLPSENNKFAMMTGRDKAFTREGPAAPGFEAENVLPTLTKKVVEIIGERAAAAKAGKPFFIYMPLNSPHTPIAPTREWLGKSGLNPYADFVMETDSCVGEVLAALDKNGLSKSTLLIFTSDNGCSPQANFDELKAKGHNPSYVFRGMKADIYDGGHHIPFLVRWPGRVKPGTRSDKIICLNDLMRTAAEITGTTLPDNAAEDSVSILPALLGQNKTLHDGIVFHSINGSFSIRQGNWKLELCPGSGGWSAPLPSQDTTKLPLIQLYDLSADIGETNNVQAGHADVVERLTKLLEKYVADGRSTPGAVQPNTVTPDIWKAGMTAHQPKKNKAKLKPAE